MNRRSFLKGCIGFSALAATRGFGITNLSYANAATSNSPRSEPQNDLLVYVFVRGGMDGLNLVAPFNTSRADRDAYYTKLRPNLNIPAPNTSAQRKLTDLDGKFGLHPDACRGARGVFTPNQTESDTGGLLSLFRSGDLAIVHAAGSLDGTGSHFDTQLYVDTGNTSSTSGWVTRYLQSANAPQDALVMSPSQATPLSLSEWYGATAIPNADAFGPIWVDGGDEYVQSLVEAQRAVLQPMFSGDTSFVHAIGQSALHSLDPLHSALTQTYTPAATSQMGDSTPDGGMFGRAMHTVARLAKSNLSNPLRVACVDVGGGWDTHDNQGTTEPNSDYCRLIANLSNNLKAFHDDMSADPRWRGRFSVVVLSEFGRVLYQNSSGGCDHGSGNAMLVIGNGNVNGGRIYGQWPGLSELGNNDGLKITTDYRRVIAEVLNTRMGAPREQINQTVFPGLGYGATMGLMKAATRAPTSPRSYLPSVSMG